MHLFYIDFAALLYHTGVRDGFFPEYVTSFDTPCFELENYHRSKKTMDDLTKSLSGDEMTLMKSCASKNIKKG